MRGIPHPKIEWFKDSVAISRDDTKYQIFDHTDGLCELIVNEPNQEDSGKYVCKATNRAGTTEIQHFVLFEGKEHHIAENIHGVFHHDQSRLDKGMLFDRIEMLRFMIRWRQINNLRYILSSQISQWREW